MIQLSDKLRNQNSPSNFLIEKCLNSFPNKHAILTNTMLPHFLHPIVLSLGCKYRHFSGPTFTAGQETSQLRQKSPNTEIINETERNYLTLPQDSKRDPLCQK